MGAYCDLRPTASQYLVLSTTHQAVEDALGLASDARVTAARLAMVCSCAVVATLLPNFEVISAVTGTAGGVTALVMPALCYRHFCCTEPIDLSDPAGPAGPGGPGGAAARRRGGAEARAALVVAAFGAAGFVWSLGSVVWPAV